MADDFTADCFGQIITEDHDSGVFIRSGALFDIGLDLFFEVFAGLRTLGPNDAGFDYLAADFVWGRRNCTLQNVGQFHHHTLDLKGANAVSGRFN